MLSTATASSVAQGAASQRRFASRRLWFAAIGLVLLLASLLPPLLLLARSYLWAETVQFLVFATVAPGLIAVGAPWRLLGLARASGDGPADRLAGARRQRPTFQRAAIFLLAYMGVCLFWRVPPVMDAVARQPALIAAELVTLFPAGAGLWLELMPSPPLAPRLPRPQRAAVAALAMWSTWTVAYAFGMAANHLLVHGYQGHGLGVIADQELSAFLVWAVTGLSFIPVVIITMGRWLTRGADNNEELQRVVRDEANRMMVKGWGPRRR
jgi:cytochrome c oxidase assembly factor CtaG